MFMTKKEVVGCLSLLMNSLTQSTWNYVPIVSRSLSFQIDFHTFQGSCLKLWHTGLESSLSSALTTDGLPLLSSNTFKRENPILNKFFTKFPQVSRTVLSESVTYRLGKLSKLSRGHWQSTTFFFIMNIFLVSFKRRKENGTNSLLTFSPYIVHGSLWIALLSVRSSQKSNHSRHYTLGGIFYHLTFC